MSSLRTGVRTILEMINGAATGNYGQDPAVHGHMPYRDFILLHPPGIVLVEAPFAALGSVTTDRLGFAALTGFFALLSATSAVLVTRVARRLGLPRRARLVAGDVYALWFGSLIAEHERDHDRGVVPTWNRGMTSYVRCGMLFFRPPPAARSPARRPARSSATDRLRGSAGSTCNGQAAPPPSRRHRP